jgi:hypothetical protein
MRKSTDRAEKLKVAVAYLEGLHTNFNAGDKNALFQAIRECGRQNIPMPEWTVNAFFAATNRWYRMDVKTLDDAFGIEWPKGKRFDAAKRNQNLSYAVYRRCFELSNPELPPETRRRRDNQLFEDVGKEFGIGKTLASRYFYSFHEK